MERKRMTAEPDRKKATASQSRRAFWGAPVAVALTFLLIGCYTILKHPITSEEGLVSQASHQEYYRDRCLDCHADYATYPYGFFYGSYPEYYFEYPRWGHYYAYPWWWDHYWYDNDDEATGGNYSEGLPESQPKASRRGDLVPPYVGGTPAIPTGGASFRRSDPGATQTKGGTESETGTASPGTSTEKVRVKAADQSSDSSQSGTQPTESKEKKKASRRGGIKP
jgi:hypothetical protein